MAQPVQPSLYNKTRDTRKIIVVDLGFLGDSVHLVPALWEIKRNYPQAQLHTLSAPLGAQVLKLAPCVDQVWDFPLGPPSPPWWRHWSLIRALRREHFELAFNFSGADRTLFLTALTGAKWRVAHPGGRQHFWNSWLIPHWVPRQPRDLPVFEQRRQMLAACGLALQPSQFGLRIPESDRKWAADAVTSDAIHFSINASTHLKEWPLPHWIELGRILLRQNPKLKILATGSSKLREQERLQQFAQGMADSRVKVFTSGLSVARLTALVERCRLHVGGDSGVLHLAMAMNVPTIALFRDYAAKTEWLPQGPQHRHLLASCSCIGMKNPACATKPDPICLAQITPAQVAQAASALLA